MDREDRSSGEPKGFDDRSRGLNKFLLWIQHFRKYSQITLDELENQEELNLTSINLTRLPPGICFLQNLQRLNLNFNNLTDFSSINLGSGLKNLQILQLGFNDLTSFPIEICSLQALRVLYLNNNNLTELPSEIGLLQNLEQLYLYQNNLATLPPELGALQRLRKLNLDSNNLANFPLEICLLQNLRSLDLENNNLTSIPSEIGRLKNLESFCLNGNNLTGYRFPPEIGALRLRYITIQFEAEYFRNRRSWCVLQLARIRAGPDHKLKIWSLFQHFYKTGNKFYMECLGRVLGISSFMEAWELFSQSKIYVMDRSSSWNILVAAIGARLVIEHKIGGCAVF